MTILSGDIKFFASKNMTDTPDGGGGPTGVVIPDGASNAIFPDISELDRALGRVNIRQVVLGVTTPDTDTYLGGNVIIAEPPNDPRVAVVMVKVDDLFANRDEIKRRIESYLAGGPSYPGYLFGDMLQGQSSITIAQREGVPVPNIGDRLVLRKAFGLPGQVEQFVAVTSVASLLRTFSDSSGDFNRNIVSLGTSEPLIADFEGFDALRIDPSVEEVKARTSINEAVVANAASFYGVVPLAEPASIGDFTVRATTIRVPIVPSAQAETPIADASTNGLAYALVATGGPVVQVVSAIWTPTQSLFVGGSLLPASVAVERDGITIADKGGKLLQSGAEVGSVDYDNGVLSLSVDVFGGGAGVHTITTTPAALPQAAQRSIGIPVTLQSRALNYVLTIVPPARRSLAAHYLAAGRWYTLREDGSGALRGLDVSYGVGNLNRSTGTLQITLGALPDVGSAVILQWVEETTVAPASNAELRMSGKLYAPINTSGLISEEAGARIVAPGATALTWKHTPTGPIYTATDDGFGALTGDATGIVDYQRGVILFAPNVLPPVDTVVSISQSSSIAETLSGVVWGGSGLVRTASITPGTVPGSVRIGMGVELNCAYANLLHYQKVSKPTQIAQFTVTDNGAGGLVLPDGQACGTINNSTGAVEVSFIGLNPASLAASANLMVQIVGFGGSSGGGPYVYFTVSAYALFVSWALGSNLYPTGEVTFTHTPPTAAPLSVTLDRLMTRVNNMVEGYTLQGVSFTLDSQRHVATNTGALLADVNPATGTGTPVGSVGAATGIVALTLWQSATSNIITDWRALQAPPSSGSNDLSANTRVLFRTATAPLRPGSFSLIGEMEDGTPINVSAGTNGKIDGLRVKGTINYENGVVELVFCNTAPTSLGTIDLSYMQIAGVAVVNLDTARASTLRYNAVAYTFIPLDASIVGINSVRLPSDGLAPVHAAGRVAVVGHTKTLAPVTVSNGQTIDCTLVRLSRLRVIGQDGLAINTGFTTDLEAGTVTFTDVTGYSQPVTVEPRIEDMALVADAQLSGHVRFTRPLTHAYPVEGTYVSSALLLGDMRARVTGLFDQQSWDGVSWLDAVDGDPAPGTYNDTLAPIEVTNAGALTERWALQFQSNNTAFRIIGEHVGVIGTGSLGADCAPVNPNTGAPYFTVREAGWGSGWMAGNVLRFNTVGAMASIPLMRVIQQGPESGTDYSFSINGRGDVDRP